MRSNEPGERKDRRKDGEMRKKQLLQAVVFLAIFFIILTHLTYIIRTSGDLKARFAGLIKVSPTPAAAVTAMVQTKAHTVEVSFMKMAIASAGSMTAACSGCIIHGPLRFCANFENTIRF